MCISFVRSSASLLGRQRRLLCVRSAKLQGAGVPVPRQYRRRRAARRGDVATRLLLGQELSHTAGQARTRFVRTTTRGDGGYFKVLDWMDHYIPLCYA